jgi:chemotaxis protein CheC
MKLRMFTPEERDMLTEVATLGTAHAAGTIARVIGHQVSVEVPGVTLSPIEQVAGLMGTAEQTMKVVIVRILGEAEGVIILLMTPEDATRLVTQISLGHEASAIEEIANIFTGSSLGALSKLLKVKLLQSVPGSATDMVRAAVNEIISPLGLQNDAVLLFSMRFNVEALQARGRLFFIFDTAATEKIIAACHQQLGAGDAAGN